MDDDLTKEFEKLSLTIDYNDCIEEEDRLLLNNKRIMNMTTIDWGKCISISNQYIQRNLLRLNKNIEVYSTDDEKCPTVFDTKNNSPGFDLIIKDKDKYYRVQSKLRQVKGKTHYSTSVHFETTRRHSSKNKTGHITYSIDEFDYVLVSLILRSNNSRNDINKWRFSLIPIHILRDGENNYCVSSIPSKVLSDYKIENFTELTFE